MYILTGFYSQCSSGVKYFKVLSDDDVDNKGNKDLK